jgi:hypothetical protein
LTEKLEQLVGDCDNVDAVRREVVRLCCGVVAE